jgi:hypothetical protein
LQRSIDQIDETSRRLASKSAHVAEAPKPKAYAPHDHGTKVASSMLISKLFFFFFLKAAFCCFGNELRWNDEYLGRYYWHQKVSM